MPAINLDIAMRLAIMIACKRRLSAASRQKHRAARRLILASLVR